MKPIDAGRRGFLVDAGVAGLGAMVTNQLFTGAAAAAPSAMDTPFDVTLAFAGFMQSIGSSPDAAGGKVTFTGADPILRSHFRIGASMAIPAMGAGVGAAAIWRDRT